MISAVLFDMNDVLCRYERDRRIEWLSRLCGRPPAVVEAAIWSSGYEDLGDAGTMNAAAYLRGFGERLGYLLTREQWIAALRAAVTPIPEALGLAAEIARETPVAILTNNNRMVAREIDAIFPELRPIFGEHIFVSAEFRARKPDPEAYRRCVARLGGAPEATLFVDDSAANVAGAELAGLRGHLYTGVAPLAAALRREGLLRAG